MPIPRWYDVGIKFIRIVYLWVFYHLFLLFPGIYLTSIPSSAVHYTRFIWKSLFWFSWEFDAMLVVFDDGRVVAEIWCHEDRIMQWFHQGWVVLIRAACVVLVWGLKLTQKKIIFILGFHLIWFLGHLFLHLLGFFLSDRPPVFSGSLFFIILYF